MAIEMHKDMPGFYYAVRLEKGCLYNDCRNESEESKIPWCSLAVDPG